MCDVTRHNFEVYVPRLQELARVSSFVSIDTEFTALCLGKENRSSLFDSGRERYAKLRESATRGIICQIGVAFFVFDHETACYVVHPYNFYIRPASFGPLEPAFVCQASNLEFLTRHAFDFNKFAHDGISYLNAEQEDVLRRDLDAGLERNVSFEDEDYINSVCFDVAEWLSAAANTDGAERVVERGPLAFSYALHLELRSRFMNLWTFPTEDDREIVVRVVSALERLSLSSNKSDQTRLEAALLTRLRGFSRIVDTLVAERIPIVGHNCLMDFMLIYQQFVADLPESYEDAKSAIHAAFPSIYDTKFMTFEVRKLLDQNELFKWADVLASTNLEDLTTFMRPKRGPSDLGLQVQHCPEMFVAGDEFARYDLSRADAKFFHEAGFDAYVTGYCFIMTAHLAASVNYLSAKTMKPLSDKEHLNCVRSFANKLQIARATVTHLNLSGADPGTSRPPWLIVTGRGPISASLVASSLSRFGGGADVRQHSRREVLVAAANRKISSNIRSAFGGGDSTFTTTDYSPIRHSLALRATFWAAVSASSLAGICFGAFSWMKNR